MGTPSRALRAWAGSSPGGPTRAEADIEAVIDIALLALLAAIGIGLIRERNLFAVVMLGGLYSLVCAALYTALDAVDVAFTEAAVGAGVSTVLLLGTLALVGKEEAVPARRPVLPLLIVLLTGGTLVFGLTDMPPFGDPDNPVHHHVAPEYIVGSDEHIGSANIVTSVLASYRGYDTMGETTVIFTAIVAVLLLIATGPRPRRASPMAEADAAEGRTAPGGTDG